MTTPHRLITTFAALLLTSAANSQLHQMIHECLQTNVIREDGLRRLAHTTVALCRMRCRWVELAEQETRLRASSIANNETRQREAVLDEILGVLLRRLKQSRKVLVAFLVLVSCLAPLGHRLAVKDEDVEEGVEKQDGLILDRGRVKEDGLATLVVEAVAIERGLNHNERVTNILVVQHVAVESGLVRRVVEDLQELRATKVEHELWV